MTLFAPRGTLAGDRMPFDDRVGQGHVGQLLGGKYRLGELLARGGMGLVYAARNEATGRPVAVKVLRSELVTRQDLVRRVSAEARLAVEASHPNVVEVLDAGADDAGVPYLVLERLQGRTLEALLASPLPLLATLQALVPIMNALVVLHRAGIVHRDVKPSNIYLSIDVNGRVTPKLLDFGIAKALQSSGSTLTGMALGTPAYMAPEQALGYGATRPATDVWAMGVVFVRCLTGTLPFEGKVTRDEDVVLGAGLCADDLAGLPAPLVAVLQRALRVEPLQRFRDMAEFRHELLVALQQVLEAGTWPNELTIGYAASESELCALLDGVRGDASLGQRVEALVGRAAHAMTRTLSSARRVSVARRALPLLGLLGLAGAALVMVALQRAEHSAKAQRAPSALSAQPEAAAELAPAPASGDDPVFAAGGTPAPMAPQKIGVPSSQESASEGGSARARGARRSVAVKPKPSAPPEARAPRLGANRAPIIE